jgi:hypothetical protein
MIDNALARRDAKNGLPGVRLRHAPWSPAVEIRELRRCERLVA